MDNLILEYNGNQLRKVTDSGAVPTHAGTFNFVNRTNDGRTDEYLYDENGNLIQDFNKKIADIQYTPLNLPQHIIFKIHKQIDYLYQSEQGFATAVTRICRGRNRILPRPPQNFTAAVAKPSIRSIILYVYRKIDL
ncbi:hypothetical protein [Bacteroides sp. 224]|uniref:hypothetical protein n=1 Tax=Bacteroides sp. 224 TaxID=2302936 RepID=UPI0013D73A31|nr:hypothetical protein [Bacteroides sp. 224]NDV63765.1 hypothetical protein [Bacteroides sp. 224]